MGRPLIPSVAEDTSPTQPIASMPMPAGDEATDERLLCEGERLGHRYVLRHRIGRGGMGDVYLAHDQMLDKDVALKFMRTCLASDVEGAVQLRTEVRLAQQVTHRNVCRIYDLEEITGRLLIKMEYVEGQTLDERIEQQGPVGIAEVISLARQITTGLAAAHAQGVIHCDLKPANIVIETMTGRVVLMDFGIARASAVHGQGQGGATGVKPISPIGTPEYMAPEQVRNLPLDARSDLYALGCVLFRTLTGHPPYPAADPMQAAVRQVRDPIPDLAAQRPDAPAWLRDLIARLLAKEPASRPPDAQAVLAILAGPSLLAAPVSQRTPGMFLAILMLVLAAAVLGIAQHRLGLGSGTQWQPHIESDLAVYSENATAPRLSPDGRFMAYMSDRDGQWNVYIEPRRGGSARAVLPVSSDQGVLDPRWSPDGRLTFIRDTRLWSIAPEGNTPEVVEENVAHGQICAGFTVVSRFSGDGSGSRSILIYEHAASHGAPPRELVRLSPRMYLHQLACDHAGRRIAYTVSRRADAGDDLYVISLAGGGPRRLTEDRSQQIVYFVFAPDDRTLVYSTRIDHAVDVWEVSVTSLARLRLLSNASVFVGDIARDSGALYFDLDLSRVSLFAVSVDTGHRQHIPTRRDVTGPLLAVPDGRSAVVFQTHAGHTDAVLVPLGGGEERVLQEDVLTAALSQDGRELIYAADRPGGHEEIEIFARPLAGGLARMVTSTRGAVRRLYCDAQGVVHISMVDSRQGAWRVPLAGGAAVQEAEPPVAGVMPGRDGWRLASLGGDRFAVVAPGRALSDPERRVLRSGIHAYWAPDGRNIVYLRNRAVQLYDPRTQSERTLVELKLMREFALMADGRSVLILEDTGTIQRQRVTNFASRPRPLP